MSNQYKIGQLIVEHDNIVCPQIESQHQTIEDIDAELSKHLASPVDFPPILQAIVPGDNVAIAIAPGLTHAAEIIRVIVGHLAQADISAEQIVIVIPSGSYQCNSFGSIRVVEHDSADSKSLAYLMASPDAQPVYLNRALVEADVVIPIGATRSTGDTDSIFPQFSNQEILESINRMKPDKRNQFVEEVNNWLGIFWQIRVNLGPADSLLHIHVGERKSINRIARQFAQEIWQVAIDQPSSLVIATMDSQGDQDWRGIYRCVYQCDVACQPDANIAIVTHVSDKPSISHLAKDRRLADILARHHVFLFSKLPQSTVEKTGFGFIESHDQLQRLLDQHERPLLIRDAHHALVQLQEQTAFIR